MRIILYQLNCHTGWKGEQVFEYRNIWNFLHHIAAGCPGGEGNYGFNSFNFMTFTLLVFNLVANVNNNLNNNNNNANKNNINAISQDSNNVASNTNAVNQIGVTVLPIPGKRYT